MLYCVSPEPVHTYQIEFRQEVTYLRGMVPIPLAQVFPYSDFYNLLVN